MNTFDGDDLPQLKEIASHTRTLKSALQQVLPACRPGGPALLGLTALTALISCAKIPDAPCSQLEGLKVIM
jgi:hypothetical protein